MENWRLKRRTGSRRKQTARTMSSATQAGNALIPCT